jgi:hypothetical protein
VKIELNYDQIDEVIIQELSRHSCLLESNIVDLKKRKKTLRKFEKEDEKLFKEVLAAMKIVLDYWTPPK